MSNKQLAEVSFSHNQPIPWRIIDAGLCLEGRCLANNGLCNAYRQMVIGNIRIGQFTISRMSIFECPMCGNNVHAEKFGLNRCQWRIMNTHKWSNVNDVYQTYNLSSFPIHIEIRSLDKDHDSIEDCTICLLSMDKKNKCSILPCKHIFHMECIHSWIDAEEETSFQCPVCRRAIFE
jgi:predicted RNA-binding Zn-ribbon protein involved in translation (DUF1610 family)